MHKQMMRILVVIIFLLSLLGGSGCVSEDYTVLDGNESVTEKHTSFVTWLDADGSIIATEQVPEDYDPSTRALPKDSSSWHYTGWQLTHSGDIIVCSATRVAMKHYIWKDYDGTLLKDVYVPENEEIPSLDLPQSNEKWNYIEWTQEGSNSDILFKAKREPNKDFFVGNIFQIILKDQSGNILGSGSGFVINQDGWFITNDHVMEKGHSAIAFFDIMLYNIPKFDKGVLHCDNS